LPDPALTVAVVYPDLLGLYADRGNALALRHRARLRGLDVEILDVPAGCGVPEGADAYLLGGGEDAAMLPALRLLRGERGFVRAVERGAVVLGVCAGFQFLGRQLTGPDGAIVEGLGHLDVVSRSLPRRAVGEVVARSSLLGELQGFENHRGDARLGPGVAALATVVHGVGNGGDGAGEAVGEGAMAGNVVGTYLHGPVLVRNPALADLLLSKMTGAPLPEVRDEPVERLRAERRAAIGGRRRLLSRTWARRA
jgi:CobQ-like glutamine amidotransferase family enzyme